MNEIICDVAVIGGGPAGLAAAVSAKKEGAEKVLILERDNALGGILQQCIHPGFGLTLFKSELTGPEYYSRFLDEAKELGVEALLDTMVLEVEPEAGKILCVSKTNGMTTVTARSIVLSMGCRERTRAQIMTPGTRPSGLYTAGSAQRLVNRQNIMVGKKIVIVGSGDIGMIMARRMTLEGAEVVMVVEILDYLAGLTRNRVQCLDDFGIPLKLSHTVTAIEGERRVTGVRIAPLDGNRNPILEKEELVECDTVLFSVGLIPENELTRKAGVKMSPITNGPEVNQYMQTSAEKLFACGNVLHVNDLVDNVSVESGIAGKYAAKYAMGTFPKTDTVVPLETGRNVRYTCPQKICLPEEDTVRVFFRALKPEANAVLKAYCGDKQIASAKKIRVSPGEMDHLNLKGSDISEGKITVCIEEG